MVSKILIYNQGWSHLLEGADLVQDGLLPIIRKVLLQMVEALTLLDRRFADDGLRLEGAVVLNAQELQQVRLLVLQLLSPHPLPTGGVHLPQLVGQDDAVPAQLSPSSGMGQRNALFAEPLHAPANLLAVPAALQVQAWEGLLEGEPLNLHRPLALPRLRRPHLRPPRHSLAPAPLP
jgi:hypothetical protein